MTSPGQPKTCAICGEDCSNKPRTKDRKGRYFCRTCYETALEKRRRRAERERLAARAAEPPVQEESAPAGDADAGYALVEDPVPKQTKAPESGTGSAAPCPGCDKPLPTGTRICVDCGINVETGRSIVMSRGVDENMVHYNAERVLRPVSWLLSIGFSPVASEAMGTRRPYVTWAVLGLTCLVSVWFWLSTDAQMQSRKNLMLWSGREQPTASYILELYEWTDWGDERAFQSALNDVLSRDGSGPPRSRRPNDEEVIAAYETLDDRQRVLGSFRGGQLFTHALLHADIFHLAGNMVFLIIFGSRVNALIGNIATLVLYPVLGILAALAEMMASSHAMPTAMLGASGAIMGLAGMYFVLFPLNRMHMSAWFRWWFYFRMKVWPVRGVWVVLFYIAWDILYISLGADTGTAHWAHLGGFIGGMLLALGLLFSRILYAGGTDLVSIVLGRHAWALFGRPGDRDRIGISMPRI